MRRMCFGCGEMFEPPEKNPDTIYCEDCHYIVNVCGIPREFKARMVS